MQTQIHEFKDWLKPHNSLLVGVDPNHELCHVVIHSTKGEPIMLNDTDALKLCQTILFAVKGYTA